MLKEGGTQTGRGDTLFSVWHKFKKQGEEHQEYNYTSKNEQSWVPNGGYLAWCKDQPLCENGFKYVLWPTAFLEHPIYFQDCELTFGKRLALSLLCISCINCKIKQTRIKNWPQNIAFCPQTSNSLKLLSNIFILQSTYLLWLKSACHPTSHLLLQLWIILFTLPSLFQTSPCPLIHLSDLCMHGPLRHLNPLFLILPSCVL